MNRLLFAVLGIACFTAGWWLDAWVGERSDDAAPAMEQKTPPAGVENISGETKAAAAVGPGAGITPLAGIHSVEDLLKLNVPGRNFASRVQLLRAAAGLSAAELAEFAEELVAMEESPDVDPEAIPAALVAVVARWLTVDPEAAAVFTARHRDRMYMGGRNIIDPRFREAVITLFKDDLAAAIRVMSNFQNRDAYIDLRVDAIEAIKDMDPKAGLERIFEFDAKTRNDRYGAQVLGEFPRRWVEKSPQEAINWALALPACYTRGQILEYLTMEWAKIDPAAAASFVRAIPLAALPNGRLRSEVMERLSSGTQGTPPPQ